jgi:TRAP-type C4-dicarboxylate transport system substrate-binding protein
MWMRVMRDAAKEVAKQTNNQVRIKFYPGGVMGGDEAVLRKIRLGQLHGGVFVSGTLTKFYPDNLVYGLPLIFKSYKEVDYVRERMDGTIIQGLEKNGFVTFGLAEGGFAYLMSKKPIHSIEDLRKQKVWIPDNDEASLEILKTFGVSPIPLSLADVRPALQTGLIDTVATSPVGAIALQWHTQVHYVTDIPLFYLYGMLAVEGKAFQRFPLEHQAIMRETMGEAYSKIDRRIRKDNDEAFTALKNQGLEFIQPSKETLKHWKTSAFDATKQMIRSGRLSKDIVDVLEGHISDYRSRASNTHESN